MTALRPAAFLCRRLTAATEALIRQRYDVTLDEADSVLAPETIAQRAKGCNILFATATERIDAGLIDALSPSLKAIATLSVGFDHIDLDAAKARGIHVLHTPDVLSDACAEIALMLILNACRRGYEADRLVRSGKWEGWSASGWASSAWDASAAASPNVPKASGCRSCTITGAVSTNRWSSARPIMLA